MAEPEPTSNLNLGKPVVIRVRPIAPKPSQLVLHQAQLSLIHQRNRQQTTQQFVVRQVPQAVMRHTQQPQAVIRQQPQAVIRQQPQAVIRQQPQAVIRQQPQAVIIQQPQAVIRQQPQAVIQKQTKRAAEECLAQLDTLDETDADAPDLPNNSAPDPPNKPAPVTPAVKTRKYWSSAVDPDIYPDVTDVGDLFLDILAKPEFWNLLNDTATRKETVWRKIAEELERLGYKADDNLSVAARICEVKFNNMKGKYKTFKDNGGPGSTGNAGKKVPSYYDKIDALLGGNDDITPQSVIDSLDDVVESTSSESGEKSTDNIIRHVNKSCKPGTPKKQKLDKIMLEEMKLTREQIAQNHSEFMDYMKTDKEKTRQIQERNASAFESLVAHITGKPRASNSDSN
ncbi:unnamed protein product [Bemisia tabaci]|uniref:Myb/SANT-like DNA-binding domain-containing protein n=1 Tax=Bemisia tabaci TaxID=7038 RepID=A0A9P0AEV5_BEMTA|nr:unnamed protein product [Bemisia tabaci]